VRKKEAILLLTKRTAVERKD